jgi:hypothetical protein
MTDLLERIRAAFDAPRFCPDCGQTIRVKAVDTFDPKTGAPVPRWVWSCPDVDLTVTHSGVRRVAQSGYTIHPWGEGRPRWHRLEVDAP